MKQRSASSILPPSAVSTALVADLRAGADPDRAAAQWKHVLAPTRVPSPILCGATEYSLRPQARRPVRTLEELRIGFVDYAPIGLNAREAARSLRLREQLSPPSLPSCSQW